MADSETSETSEVAVAERIAQLLSDESAAGAQLPTSIAADVRQVFAENSNQTLKAAALTSAATRLVQTILNGTVETKG